MRTIIACIVALLLFVIAVVIYGVVHNQQATRTGSLCAEYGIPADDPRSNPEPLPETDETGEKREVAPDNSIKMNQPLDVHGIRSRYHVFARGVDFSKPVGVVMRLHGDGAYEYDHPEGLLNCMASVAASHNMILVAPRTPDHEGTRTWWENIGESSEWLSGLISRLREDYDNVDTHNMWWMGYSGGAELISYGLLAQEPENITAGAIMIGGGGPYRQTRPRTNTKRQVALVLVRGQQRQRQRSALNLQRPERSQQRRTLVPLTWLRQCSRVRHGRRRPLQHSPSQNP